VSLAWPDVEKKTQNVKVIGIEMTRTGFRVVGKKGRSTVEICLKKNGKEWFDDRGKPTHEFGSEQIGSAINQLGGYAPVHVSLPNPTVRFLTLRTEERPHSRKETERLLDWHAGRVGAPLEKFAVIDYQWTGKSGGEHNLFGICAERSLVSALIEPLEPHCVRLLVPSIGLLLKALAKISQATVLIDIDDESWAIIVVDENGNVRIARAGWRYASDDPESIASEARRLVNAAGSRCEPKEIVFWCDSLERLALEKALQGNFMAQMFDIRDAESLAPHGGIFTKAALAALI
jgi:hypothetical protein